LRAAIDSLRVAGGLAPFAWTDPTLAPGVATAKAVHLIELRAALNQAYQALAKTPPAYADPAVMAGQTIITTVQLNELRSAVRGHLRAAWPSSSCDVTVGRDWAAEAPRGRRSPSPGRWPRTPEASADGFPPESILFGSPGAPTPPSVRSRSGRTSSRAAERSGCPKCPRAASRSPSPGGPQSGCNRCAGCRSG